MTEAPDSVYSTSSRSRKYIVTFILCYCNFFVGSCVSFMNPLVLDFSYKFDTSVEAVSRVFTVTQISYLVSALLGAVLLNYINRQLYSLFHLLLLLTPFIVLPHAKSITVFFAFSSFIGLGLGGFDTAQIAWMIDIWRHESAPFILCQHFAFSVGTMVPPLLLAPFLTNKISNASITDITNITTMAATESINDSAELYIPFYVVAAMVVIGIVMHCGLSFTYKIRTIVYGVNSNAEHLKDIPEDEITCIPEDSLKRKMFLVALACLIIGFYSALELCTSQFLPTFSNFSDVHLSESEAARVLFGLQLGFSTGRLVGIILVLKIAPQFLFIGNFAVILVSNIILCWLGGSSLTWLWIGSVSIGVGMSTVYPVLYAYIEKYIFVNTTVAGVITVAGGLVSSMYPLIVGNSVEKNPRILTYMNFVSIAVCTAAFSILFWTTQTRSKRGKECRGGAMIRFKSIPTE